MRSRHFPAHDLDCEDMDPETPAATPRVSAQRRIRERTVAGQPSDAVATKLVECPFREEWPGLDACLGCPQFKGYSLDPVGRQSFVSCGRTDDAPPRPIPRNATTRSVSLRETVRGVMSDPVCVREHLTLCELARLFRDRSVNGVPVVDPSGRALGVVTKTDLIAACATRLDPGTVPASPAPGAAPTPVPSAASALRVRDIMSPALFTLPESASIAEAAALMAKRCVHGVPITSPSGQVVGVLTALDLVRWVASPAVPTDTLPLRAAL